MFAGLSSNKGPQKKPIDSQFYNTPLLQIPSSSMETRSVFNQEYRLKTVGNIFGGYRGHASPKGEQLDSLI